MTRISKSMTGFVCFLLMSCSLPTGAVSGNEEFQEAVLQEVNSARTNPSSYADNRLYGRYEAGTDNGAYEDLKSRSSMEPLQLRSELFAASTKYAEYMAVNDVFGHYGNGSPQDRCEAEGYGDFSGENIAAGSYSYLNADTDPETAAVRFVLEWIIDTDVDGVGHRENIMDPTHTHTGIGFHHDGGSTYENYAVQDFGRED